MIVGDHVRVISGDYRGFLGTIISGFGARTQVRMWSLWGGSLDLPFRPDQLVVVAQSELTEEEWAACVRAQLRFGEVL